MQPRPITTPEQSRRRFRTLNLVTMLPIVTAVGVFLVAVQSQTWEQAVVLGLGLVALVVVFERWTAGDIRRVAIPCLIVAAAVWPYAVLTVHAQTQAGYYAITVVGALVVSQLPRHRGIVGIALVIYVATVGAIGVIVTESTARGGVITDVIIPTGITAVLVGLMYPNKRFYDVVADLERDREREAELAVMRERMRFASDLHDIQGHTLHVVKLKIALAQKLLRTDTDRAEEELREVYELVGDTIARTRELAYGQRRLNLSAEIENARHLLEATGMHVRVDRTDDINSELLAQVLRETTTNILRHSRATLVRIEVSRDGITIVNDGVELDEVPPLRGLEVLASRVADAGGELTVRIEGGRFVTSATLPEVQP